MKGGRVHGRALAGVLALFLACAVLAGCAGRGIEVKPRGEAVISVGAGSR